jgi:hypothetical protein
MKKINILNLLIIVGIVLLFLIPTSGTHVFAGDGRGDVCYVDQETSNTNTDLVYNYKFAQSFTAEFNTLTRVALRLSKNHAGFADNIQVDICSCLSPYTPLESKIIQPDYQHELPIPPGYDWREVDFDNPLPVRVNQQYFIVCFSNPQSGNAYEWWYSTSNVYNYGDYWSQNYPPNWHEETDWDFAFKVWGETSTYNPHITISPDHYAFGHIPKGTQSSPETFELQNTGTGVACGSVFIVNGECFKITRGGGDFEVYPGVIHEKDIDVVFCPDGTGDYSDTLYASGLMGCNDVSVPVSGTGTKTGLWAGTKITMSDGSYKNIENIQVGDSVKSYDIINHQVIVGTVTATIRYGANEGDNNYIKVNSLLYITSNKSLLRNGQWVQARVINLGDYVNPPNMQILINSINRVLNTALVYNLVVQSPGQSAYNYVPFFANGFLTTVV